MVGQCPSVVDQWTSAPVQQQPPRHMLLSHGGTVYQCSGPVDQCNSPAVGGSRGLREIGPASLYLLEFRVWGFGGFRSGTRKFTPWTYTFTPWACKFTPWNCKFTPWIYI
eukprot:1179960-Prorocentrum_minimum.AAC.5